MKTKKNIACISYINALPLSFFIKNYNIYKSIPSNVAKAFKENKFNVALISIFEVFQYKKIFIIDNISISAKKKVDSVLLFLNKDIKKITNTALDESSRSSSNLVKLILKNHNNCKFTWLPIEKILKSYNNYDSYLIIGDQALKHKENHKNYIDLATHWYNKTKLPFVFAVWASFKKENEIKKDLEIAKKTGLKNLNTIINKTKFNYQLKNYYKNLNFDLTKNHKQSIKLYQEELYKAKILKNKYNLNYY